MSIFQKMVCRGNAIMREWNNPEGLNESNQRMLAELAANVLANLCGKELGHMTENERTDKANLARIAVTSAFQIGNANSRKLNKNKKA